MKGSVLQIRILPALVLLSGLLALQWALVPEADTVRLQQKKEKINLAMRQAAHRLLAHAGDTASTIPPVRQVFENEFQLRIEHHFNYDSLPVYLQAALDAYGIEDDYNVTIKSCEAADVLLLGYTRADFMKENDVPCKGRDQGEGCHLLSLVFPEWQAGQAASGDGLRWLLMGGTVLSLGYLIFTLWFFVKNSRRAVQAEVVADNGDSLQFGNTTFEVTNQVVLIDGHRQELTFREAKLLHIFSKNINQLLDRSQLLEEVWGDEGVIVGRSLDVFVSRLRKILKMDTSVKIVNVHSVGYRMEVAEK